MGDAFLEQLYRWLEPIADWLLASSRMEWLAHVVEETRMADALLLASMLLVGVGLGALFAIGCYVTELGRQARSLSARDRSSNVRLTCGSRLPGMVAMVDAVNAELDAADEERVEALRAADEFSRGLSALSHDVRTPLTGARGYLQLAREEPDPERKDAQLAAADARLAAMSGLLDELFSYARAADPDTPLEIAPVALRPVLEQALLGHYPEFEERGWEPELDLPDPAPVVRADADSLARIVENLTVNALRHGSGPLRVTARRAGTAASSRSSRTRWRTLPQSMPSVSSSASTRRTPRARRPAPGWGSPLPASLLPPRGWRSPPACTAPSLPLR